MSIIEPPVPWKDSNSDPLTDLNKAAEEMIHGSNPPGLVIETKPVIVCPLCQSTDIGLHCERNAKCNWSKCRTCRAYGPSHDARRWTRIDDDEAIAS